MGRPIRVRLFATARAAVGRPTIDWPAVADGIPVRELLRALAERYPALRRTLRAARYLRNGRYLDDLEGTLRPGDEFSIHPPYGGG